MSLPTDRPLAGEVYRVVRRRPRLISEERRWFLIAIRGQLAGARLLAYLAIAVAVGSGAWWIMGTTGSWLIGVAFIALGVTLGASIWAFAGLMQLIGGAPISSAAATSPAAPPEAPAAPTGQPLPNPNHQTP
jgi:hypothetical protein